MARENGYRAPRRAREFTSRPARRTNAVPLIGLYGQSGSGKTFTALLMARGIVGPKGRVVLVDTEPGRGDAFADEIPGGYEVVPFHAPPYGPLDYIDAIDEALRMRADAVVIDSASHEWEGIGGVLQMASDIEERTGKPGLHCWKDPKLQHQRFVLKMLQCPVPVIVCMRAKYKSRQVKGHNGKNEIVKDDHTTPTQAEDFIFEMTVHAEMLMNEHGIGGYFRLTKCSPPSLRACFPRDGQLGIKTGEAIARWAAGGDSTTQGQAAHTTTQAPAIGAEEAEEVMREALQVAQQGRAALDRHYRAASNAHKKILYANMEQLVAIADDADMGPPADYPEDEQPPGETDPLDDDWSGQPPPPVEQGDLLGGRA